MSAETETNWGVDGVPGFTMDDPGMVEAWFSPGSWSHYEHYRKVVLAGCAEAIRAKCAVDGEKMSETRMTDLSRLHPNYLAYLADTLTGRGVRETMIRQRMGV